ncbi:MAG: DUF1634 domain-containing protein [Candidatus Zixiibacteriota bacterium]
MKKENSLYSNVNLILKIGAYSAFIILILGLALFLFTSPGPARDAKLLPMSVGELLSSLSGFQPQGVINIGLLVLMFTPMLRVIIALFSFLKLKDFKYSLISLGVFLILFSGLMVAIF